MLIDWIVGRDCRGGVERQAKAIDTARRAAHLDIARLRKVSLDLADVSGERGQASRDAIVRMARCFGIEVNQRVSDVFGRIIERMKGNFAE